MISLLPRNPSPGDIVKVSQSVSGFLRKGTELILGRCEGNPSYPWIDTKFNVGTGEDFLDSDPIRGRSVVYSWIQGRGLEALSEYLRFFMRTETSGRSNSADAGFSERCLRLLSGVSLRMRRARDEGGGHMHFAMSPEGLPLGFSAEGSFRRKALAPHGPFTLSDIFASRGLLAAAIALKDAGLLDESVRYCTSLKDAVREGNYRSDQEQFDIRNPVRPVSGRYSHAPYMLQIPTMTLLVSQAIPGAVESGLEIIRHIIDYHVITKPLGGLAEWDFCEFIGDDGDPYEQEGRILSDPGHALEFVGLTAQFCLSVAESACATDRQRGLVVEVLKSLPKIFGRNFQNGFDRGHGGIVKLFDLLSRKPVNGDLPWWSLPETMRAAVGCLSFASDSERSFLLDSYSSCHNALFSFYAKEESGFCIQSRDEDGEVSDTIPAVPDADPNYHTGLPLIFCIERLGNFSVSSS